MLGVFAYSLGFSRMEAQIHSGVVESDQFSTPLVAIASEPLKIRTEFSYDHRQEYSAWTLVCVGKFSCG